MMLASLRPRSVFIPLLLVATVGLSACEKPKPAAMPAAKVTVSKPLQQTVQSYETFDGTAAPLLNVNLEARVSGYLEKILYKDGASVNKGDLLFVIEQDQYKEQVALNQAIYDEAKIEFDRQSGLLAQKATSQAAVDKARSQLGQAQANLALAKINLGYTEVRAPFDGVVNRHLIDVGNYLGSNPDGIKLAEIRQISPLYVYFSMNEMELLTYLRFRRGEPGQSASDLVGKLPVYVGLQGDEGYPHEGVLDYAASNLDIKTGALQLRALFPNKDRLIVPGVYARVLVYYGDKRNALLVPFGAVMRDQQGDYLLAIGKDNKVERRNIVPGQKFGALLEVVKGLSAEDSVIINGFVTLSVGQTVEPQTGQIPPPKLPGTSR